MVPLAAAEHAQALAPDTGLASSQCSLRRQLTVSGNGSVFVPSTPDPNIDHSAGRSVLVLGTSNEPGPKWWDSGTGAEASCHAHPPGRLAPFSGLILDHLP
jgi:hypothetical protein